MESNMQSFMALIGAFVVGLLVRLLIDRIRRRSSEDLDTVDTDIPSRLDQDEYEMRMAKADERYHDAMAQYDRLGSKDRISTFDK